MSNINDSARGLPMTPATAAIAAMNLINADEPPMACCPKDGEPLISTFKYPGAEFVCMVCGGLFGFLAPVPKDAATPGLQERHDELRARFDAGDKPGSVKDVPVRFAPSLFGGPPLMECVGDSEDEAIGNLLDHLDDPEIESWKQARDIGYEITTVEDTVDA